MATTLIIRRLDPELHRALKMRAAREGKTLMELIREMLEKAVREG